MATATTPVSENKWVYAFGEGPQDKRVLGGKGLGLAQMAAIGLPVPPGFTISMPACNYVSKHHAPPPGMDAEVAKELARLQSKTGKAFGTGKAGPNGILLVSVRSGSSVSLPVRCRRARDPPRGPSGTDAAAGARRRA